MKDLFKAILVPIVLGCALIVTVITLVNFDNSKLGEHYKIPAANVPVDLQEVHVDRCFMPIGHRFTALAYGAKMKVLDLYEEENPNQVYRLYCTMKKEK